jgi:aspartyl-tRNA(Asn)/glutamyl-tRNA(Gln) amidotransferase subunit A
MNPCALTIHEAHQLLKNGEISALELTDALLERIDTVDTKVGAYITVAAELARSQANQADKAIAAGHCQPLTGIPLAIKDLICTKGLKTTCASKILANFIPPYDATVIKALRAQNAVIIGKANMDEFAMGSSNEHSAFHPVHNPWNLACIPGGSSGGSAAAVAADLCLGALGSDTGGSIRQPASHCGVVGLKPTYGRVSRFGLVAFASSLDQIGPLSKDVIDSAWLLQAIAGYDASDSTSVDEVVPDYRQWLADGLKGIKIGIVKEYQQAQGLDPEVAQSVTEALKVLEGLGAECVEISLPNSDFVVAAYYVIAPAEASSNLARYDGVKYGFRHADSTGFREMYRNTRSDGFGAEVQRRIIVGTYCLSAGYYDAYYGKASKVRTLIRQDYMRAFKQCDVIASPVAPTPAFKIGELSDDPLTMYLSDIFTLSANLAGIPGLSLPAGYAQSGLPIGIQLLGNHFNEAILLKVAYNLEQATKANRRKPAI